MNKKLLYAFVAGSLLSLSSCNDFLDVTPASDLPPITYSLPRRR